jgi:hypothetical protein
VYTNASESTRHKHAGPRQESRSPAQDTRPRILAVDDQSDTLTIVRLLLSGEGFEVITTESTPADLSQLTPTIWGLLKRPKTPRFPAELLSDMCLSRPRLSFIIGDVPTYPPCTGKLTITGASTWLRRFG